MKKSVIKSNIKGIWQIITAISLILLFILFIFYHIITDLWKILIIIIIMALIIYYLREFVKRKFPNSRLNKFFIKIFDWIQEFFEELFSWI